MKYLFMLLSLLIQSTSMAEGGGSVGNGGKGINAFLTEAIVKMDELLIRECNKPPTENSNWNDLVCQVPKKLFDTIMKTKITTDYLVYGKIDHKPRDAINNTLETGESVITYSIRNLKFASPDFRRRILLHEFLTLAGFETTDSYGYSTVVLSFLQQFPELDSVLKTFPDNSSDQKTFRGLEATIGDGQEVYPVLITGTEDYRRFCIAKGFVDFIPLYLSDISYREWMKSARSSGGAVLLNDEGVIVRSEDKPSKKARVINTITCH